MDPTWLLSLLVIFSVVALPLAIVLLVAFFVVEIWKALRQGWYRYMGRCWHCGYNLTGNVTGVCPECGTIQRPSGHDGGRSQS